ncbi:hypothetical protein ACFXPA_47975, partial [Amycolatopsis sp. NPDC059090]|uniref:hypothetical protein n=1 Tax=Amycolatopsis sp. NPDC059090 TaxID=3346723 RepID=UPI00366AA8A8
MALNAAGRLAWHPVLTRWANETGDGPIVTVVLPGTRKSWWQLWKTRPKKVRFRAKDARSWLVTDKSGLPVGVSFTDNGGEDYVDTAGGVYVQSVWHHRGFDGARYAWRQRGNADLPERTVVAEPRRRAGFPGRVQVPGSEDYARHPLGPIRFWDHASREAQLGVQLPAGTKLAGPRWRTLGRRSRLHQDTEVRVSASDFAHVLDQSEDFRTAFRVRPDMSIAGAACYAGSSGAGTAMMDVLYRKLGYVNDAHFPLGGVHFEAEDHAGSSAEIGDAHPVDGGGWATVSRGGDGAAESRVREDTVYPEFARHALASLHAWDGYLGRQDDLRQELLKHRELRFAAGVNRDRLVSGDGGHVRNQFNSMLAGAESIRLGRTVAALPGGPVSVGEAEKRLGGRLVSAPVEEIRRHLQRPDQPVGAQGVVFMDGQWLLAHKARDGQVYVVDAHRGQMADLVTRLGRDGQGNPVHGPSGFMPMPGTGARPLGNQRLDPALRGGSSDESDDGLPGPAAPRTGEAEPGGLPVRGKRSAGVAALAVAASDTAALAPTGQDPDSTVGLGDVEGTGLDHTPSGTRAQAMFSIIRNVPFVSTDRDSGGASSASDILPGGVVFSRPKTALGGSEIGMIAEIDGEEHLVKTGITRSLVGQAVALYTSGKTEVAAKRLGFIVENSLRLGVESGLGKDELKRAVTDVFLAFMHTERGHELADRERTGALGIDEVTEILASLVRADPRLRNPLGIPDVFDVVNGVAGQDLVNVWHGTYLAGALIPDASLLAAPGTMLTASRLVSNAVPLETFLTRPFLPAGISLAEAKQAAALVKQADAGNIAEPADLARARELIARIADPRNLREGQRVLAAMLREKGLDGFFGSLLARLALGESADLGPDNMLMVVGDDGRNKVVNVDVTGFRYERELEVRKTPHDPPRRGWGPVVENPELALDVLLDSTVLSSRYARGLETVHRPIVDALREAIPHAAAPEANAVRRWYAALDPDEANAALLSLRPRLQSMARMDWMPDAEILDQVLRRNAAFLANIVQKSQAGLIAALEPKAGVPSAASAQTGPGATTPLRTVPVEYQDLVLGGTSLKVVTVPLLSPGRRAGVAFPLPGEERVLAKTQVEDDEDVLVFHQATRGVPVWALGTGDAAAVVLLDRDKFGKLVAATGFPWSDGRDRHVALLTCQPPDAADPGLAAGLGALLDDGYRGPKSDRVEILSDGTRRELARDEEPTSGSVVLGPKRDKGKGKAVAGPGEDSESDGGGVGRSPGDPAVAESEGVEGGGRKRPAGKRSQLRRVKSRRAVSSGGSRELWTGNTSAYAADVSIRKAEGFAGAIRTAAAKARESYEEGREPVPVRGVFRGSKNAVGNGVHVSWGVALERWIDEELAGVGAGLAVADLLLAVDLVAERDDEEFGKGVPAQLRLELGEGPRPLVAELRGAREVPVELARASAYQLARSSSMRVVRAAEGAMAGALLRGLGKAAPVTVIVAQQGSLSSQHEAAVRGQVRALLLEGAERVLAAVRVRAARGEPGAGIAVADLPTAEQLLPEITV